MSCIECSYLVAASEHGLVYAHLAVVHLPIGPELGAQAPEDGDAHFLLEHGRALRNLSDALSVSTT